MSDLKQTCPACQAHSSSVGAAALAGEPCPFCGLPAEAALAVRAAIARGLSAEVAQRLADAERRAGVAEARVQQLERAIEEARDLLGLATA